ncbi:MAG: OmpH family outer membrane protein, partial [Tannerella sp.]|nr:OmpH family outer membrane protein [Tannerella sp.]
MKKIIVSVLLLIPLGLAAQEIKVAVVYASEVWAVMPEVDAYESEMATVKQQYEKTLKVMQDEFTRKYSDLQAQGDTLTENIRMLRLQEVQDISTRIENFGPMAQEDIQKTSEKLLAPIQEKIQKAINEVGEEN